MHQMTTLNWIEAVGWRASILTVATYAMNTMMPLRMLAIASFALFHRLRRHSAAHVPARQAQQSDG
ncbi:hypothetical protein [uncultured Roseobacter sp.]|uniref:hypothetical protein n=1 Tax=uncultured Roseobacter sp. TaxID=114847 RepID=UPI002606AA13|nr:hypothetical protein [uncultured Roseobacter sp.]